MSSTKNYSLLQIDSGPEIISAVADRPRFYPDIGAELVSWREARAWSQRQAVLIAKNKKLKSISMQTLRFLEEGRTKSPEPNVLRDVAALYERPYEYVAGRFLLARYGLVVEGSDLPRHPGDQASESSPGGADVPASARRIAELETELADLKTRWGDVQDVARALFRIAVSREEGRATPRAQAGRGKTARRTG